MYSSCRNITTSDSITYFSRDYTAHNGPSSASLFFRVGCSPLSFLTSRFSLVRSAVNDSSLKFRRQRGVLSLLLPFISLIGVGYVLVENQIRAISRLFKFLVRRRSGSQTFTPAVFTVRRTGHSHRAGSAGSQDRCLRLGRTRSRLRCSSRLRGRFLRGGRMVADGLDVLHEIEDGGDAQQVADLFDVPSRIFAKRLT